ncbi:MAG: hypothetical protein AB1426_11905 [Bacillota bacterium]
MPKFIDPAAAIERVLGDLFREKRFRLRKVVPPHYYVYTRVGNTVHKLGFDFHWIDESQFERTFESTTLGNDGSALCSKKLANRYKHSLKVWLGTNSRSESITKHAPQLKTGFTTQEELEERLLEVRRALEESGLSFLEKIGSSANHF